MSNFIRLVLRQIIFVSSQSAKGAGSKHKQKVMYARVKLVCLGWLHGIELFQVVSVFPHSNTLL